MAMLTQLCRCPRWLSSSEKRLKGLFVMTMCFPGPSILVHTQIPTLQRWKPSMGSQEVNWIALGLPLCSTKDTRL